MHCTPYLLAKDFRALDVPVNFTDVVPLATMEDCNPPTQWYMNGAGGCWLQEPGTNLVGGDGGCPLKMAVDDLGCSCCILTPGSTFS